MGKRVREKKEKKKKKNKNKKESWKNRKRKLATVKKFLYLLPPIGISTIGFLFFFPLLLFTLPLLALKKQEPKHLHGALSCDNDKNTKT